MRDLPSSGPDATWKLKIGGCCPALKLEITHLLVFTR